MPKILLQAIDAYCSSMLIYKNAAVVFLDIILPPIKVWRNIATSAEVSPNGGLVRESPQNLFSFRVSNYRTICPDACRNGV